MVGIEACLFLEIETARTGEIDLPRFGEITIEAGRTGGSLGARPAEPTRGLLAHGIGVGLNDDFHIGSTNDFHIGSTNMNSASDFHTRKATRLAQLRLDAADFEEKFSRSSGPGGQHVNKVSTAVTLRHVPTGVAVTVQDSRSQSMNRQLAWERLLDAIEGRRREERAARRAEIEKRRRQNSKRPRGLKERILESKKRRSQVKKMRARDW